MTHAILGHQDFELPIAFGIRNFDQLFASVHRPAKQQVRDVPGDDAPVDRATHLERFLLQLQHLQCVLEGFYFLAELVDFRFCLGYFDIGQFHVAATQTLLWKSNPGVSIPIRLGFCANLLF